MKSNILFGVGGMIIGALIGAAGAAALLKTKYEKEYREKEDELDRYYQNLGQYQRTNSEDEEWPEWEDQSQKPEESVSINREDGPLTPEKRREIKEKLTKNYEATTNYAAMYQKEEEEELDPEDQAMVDLTEEKTANMRKSPKLLTLEQYSNLSPSVEFDQLLYYVDNDVLVGESEEPLIDQEVFVGDCLSAFWEPDEDDIYPDTIYVMNYAMNVAYEVVKVNTEFIQD